MNTTSEPITAAEVQRAAHWCAYQTGLDPDDLLQEFHILLIERHEQFSHATRSYILQRFAWTAKHIAKAERAKTFNPLTTPGEDSEPEEIDVVDARALTPEQIVMERQERQHMAQALAQLTLRQERIARELMRGYRKGEIAQRMGVLPSIVSKELKAIRAVLGGEQIQEMRF